MAIKFLNSVNADSGVLYVDAANDRVGIGTTSPNDILVVSNGTGEVRFGGGNGRTLSAYANGNLSNFDFYANQTYFNSDFLIAPGKKISTSNGSNDNLYLTTTNTSKAVYTDRNVGIGTTNPGAKLDVQVINNTVGVQVTNAEGNTVARLRSAGTPGRGELYLDSNGTTNVFFGALGNSYINAGNVGIGTTSPSEKLTVNGNIRVANSGKIYLWNDHDSNYLDYRTWLASSSAGLTIKNAAGHIKLIAGSTEVLRAESSGNVGIGTTSPNHKLDIYSNENVPLRVHRPNNANLDSSGAWGIGFSTRGDGINSTTDTRAGIFSYYNGNLFLAAANTSIVADPDAYARLTVLSTGNVGIGTMSPTRTFQVGGAEGQISSKVGSLEGMMKVMSSKVYIGSQSSHNLALMTGAAERVTIDTSGNVGIGTTSPQALLQVGSVTSSVYSLATGNADIIAGNKDISDTQMGTLNVTSNTRDYANTNLGLGPSITFTQNGSKYVDGYEKVIGGIKAELTNANNLNYSSKLSFYTHNNSTLSERLTIREGGNVGIGTTSPSYKLDINGTARVNSKLLLDSADYAQHLSLRRGVYGMDFILTGNRLDLSPTASTTELKVLAKIRTTGDLLVDGDAQLSSYGSGSNTGTATYALAVDSSGNIIETTVQSSPAGIDGTGTVNYLTKWSTTDTLTSSVMYDDGTNIGIGTASPQAKLHLNAGSDDGLLLENGNAILGNTGSGYTEIIYWGSGSVYYGRNTPGVPGGTGGTIDNHFFRTNGATRLTVAQDGNVGIGTTSPNTKLEVAGTITANKVYIPYSGTNANSFEQVNGSFGYGRIRPFDYNGRFSFDTNYVSPGGGYDFAYNGSSVIRVDASGNVGIGTTSPAYKLDVSGDIRSTAAVRANTNLIVGGYTDISGYVHHRSDFRVVNKAQNNWLTWAFRDTTGTEVVMDLSNIGSINASGALTFSNYGAGLLKTDASGNVSLDTSTYLTSYTETSTLGQVLTRGNSTNNTIHIYHTDRGYTFQTDTSWGGWARTPFYFEDGDGTGFGGLGAYGGNGTTLSKYYIGSAYNDNIIEFHTDDTVIMHGNVGIGTTSPQSLLHISSGTSGNATLIIESDTDNNNENENPQLQFRQDGGITIAKAGLTGDAGQIFGNSLSNAAYFGNDENASVQFYTNATAALTIREDGDVGIGTTSPQTKLHVEGITRITEGGNTAFYSGNYLRLFNSQAFQFRNSGGSTVSQINLSGNSYFNGGNIGIGTTSPAQKLHVKGDIRADFNNTDGSAYLTGYGVEFERGTNYLRPRGTDGTQTLIFGGGSDSLDWNNIQFKTSDYINFRMSGSDVFRINSSGNVGIGTTSPDARLEVNTASTSDIAINANNRVKIQGDGTMTWGSSADYGQLSWDTGYALVRGMSGRGLKLQVNSSATVVTMTTGGNVGIGTTSPGYKLDVEGNTRTNGYHVLGGTGDIRDRNTHNQRFEVSGTYSSIKTGNIHRLYVNSSGNVGIGTTSPNGRLHVYGGRLVLDNAANAQTAIQFNSAGAEKIVIYRPTSTEDLRIYTPAAGDAFSLTQAGNVGIGTTAPNYKLHVDGSVGITEYLYHSGDNNTYLRFSGDRIIFQAGGYEMLRLIEGATSEVVINEGSQDLNFRVESDTDTHALFIQGSDGNVGIGTASPTRKLDVGGATRIGGKTIYTKNYGSLDTTGQAVAGLAFAGNGGSARFVFEMHGGAGSYQRIVYSCYNTSGTWNVRKQVDEGNNAFDVTATTSDSGATYVFTFKGRTANQSYSPMVTVEHVGYELDTSYL